MANAPYYFQGNTTTDSGTAIDSPLVTDIDLPTIWLTSIRVRMPPGPLGNLGFAFYNADAQIIPYSTGQTWVIGDDEIWDFDYDAEVGIQLQLWTYNTGSYDHELLYTINYTPISAANVPPEPPSAPPTDTGLVISPVNTLFQDFGEVAS